MLVLKWLFNWGVGEGDRPNFVEALMRDEQGISGIFLTYLWTSSFIGKGEV